MRVKWSVSGIRFYFSSEGKIRLKLLSASLDPSMLYLRVKPLPSVRLEARLEPCCFGPPKDWDLPSKGFTFRLLWIECKELIDSCSNRSPPPRSMLESGACKILSSRNITDAEGSFNNFSASTVTEERRWARETPLFRLKFLENCEFGFSSSVVNFCESV